MSKSISSWLVSGRLGRAGGLSPAIKTGFAPLTSARLVFHEGRSLGLNTGIRSFRPFQSISHIPATSLRCDNDTKINKRLGVTSSARPAAHAKVPLLSELVRSRAAFPTSTPLQPSNRSYSSTGGSSNKTPQPRKPVSDDGKPKETPKAGVGAETNAPGPGGEEESIVGSVSKYLHLPKMPHRPTKEELLAAANGFWERVRVRFKWMSIRSMRPWNADEWGAFVSWFMLGHIVWILVGTTTFFSLLIFSINTVFAQGK